MEQFQQLMQDRIDWANSQAERIGRDMNTVLSSADFQPEKIEKLAMILQEAANKIAELA